MERCMPKYVHSSASNAPLICFVLKSKKFSIYASTPSNYTSADLPTATITATLLEAPNPTQQWAITLNGINQDATATATSTSS